MSKVIVYQEGGEVRVIGPTPDFMAGYEAQEDALAAVINKDVPAAERAGACVCDFGALPLAYFREAWRLEGGQVTVDMVKARLFHMKQIRAVRDAKLLESDAEYVEEHSKGDSVKIDAIKAKKQQLRDAPASIDVESAQTPEALIGIWPADLERPAY